MGVDVNSFCVAEAEAAAQEEWVGEMGAGAVPEFTCFGFD